MDTEQETVHDHEPQPWEPTGDPAETGRQPIGYEPTGEPPAPKTRRLEIPVVVVIGVEVDADNQPTEWDPTAYADSDGAPWPFSGSPTAWAPEAEEWHDNDVRDVWNAAYDRVQSYFPTTDPNAPPDPLAEELRVIAHSMDEAPTWAAVDALDVAGALRTIADTIDAAR